MTRTVRLEDLLGRRVRDPSGRVVGRVEEIVARRVGPALVVTEYHLGVYAVLERLAGGGFGRAVLRVLGARGRKPRRIPWAEMDLSDPERPRLRPRP